MITKKEKGIKVGNNLRDLLMKQTETLVEKGKIYYFNEVYSFNPYTKEEIEKKYVEAKKTVAKLITPYDSFFEWIKNKFRAL